MDPANATIQGPATIGVLPGTFDPPTVAHLALAAAALAYVDRILFVVPRLLPHGKKPAASLEQRERWLRAVAAFNQDLDTVTADGGLYGEIGDEVQDRYPSARLFLICGKDAAERIFNWNYDQESYLDSMMERFELLVAPRDGRFNAPERWRHRVHHLDLASFDECSASRVREAIASGSAWTHLVPRIIADELPSIYGSDGINYSAGEISRNVRKR